MGFCEGCFEKQRKIDALQEENRSLKERLRYLKRKEQQGYFGSSTPSSKVPLKANTLEENQQKRGGAKPGHVGNGRRGFDESQADHVVRVPCQVGDRCPQCGEPLVDKGLQSHSVVDLHPVKTQRVLYREPKKYCGRCRRSFRSRAPGVLPKSLYGNQLIATTAAMHYLHGVPLGRICQQIGIALGPLIEIFHRSAKIFSSVPNRIIEQYRTSLVKHADETGWRNDGQSGYVWLFATEKISIFLFGKSRSAKIVHEALGTEPLPGTLVVDRYSAYNKAPCAIQYCYSHLLRYVEDLRKEFPDHVEIDSFVNTFAPLLATAMSLRKLPICDAQYYERAMEIKSQMIDVVHCPAQHLAIRRTQETFHENADRLYHWVTDRKIPAENNLAERDLRPTVIARKVSFGSQSDAGAHTRSVLMTVLHTLKKQTADPCAALKTGLDRLAQNQKLDPFELLFPPDT